MGVVLPGPTTDVAPAIGHAARQWATRAAFLLAGTSISAWAPLVPYAKARLGLTDGRLGLLLLCLGAGSLVAMPMAGVWAGRFGCRRVIAGAAVVIAAALPVLATAGRADVVAVALLAFGAAAGTVDVAINVNAVLVERDAGRAMMSGFHGLYSVGGIAGAGGVSLLTSAGAAPVAAAAVVAAVTLVLLAAAYPSLMAHGGDSGGGPALALPRGRVLLLGGFCFVLFLAEGSVLDWSGDFLTTVRHVADARAGLGYVAFATAMTACRLAGDRVVHALGPPPVVLLGGLTAAAGFLLAVVVPSPAAAVVGFALVGVGSSNAVPVMFSAAGRQTAMPANRAIAAMTTVGYAGILAGPALVGLVAAALGLAAGLAAIAALLVVVAVGSTRARL